MNVSSLKKFFVSLLNNDILGLTETRLQLTENTTDLKTKIQSHFRLHLNCYVKKNQSIAIGYSSTTILVDSENQNSITILSLLLKKSFCVHPIIVALVYRFPKSTVTTFIDEPSWLTTLYKVVLLRDLNIGTLCDNACVSVCDILSNYQLAVTEPTYLDGGLLDHRHLTKQFQEGKQIKAEVRNIYFPFIMQ